MLEVRNLTKRYKPKKGVPVLAVDHVNLKFPEKGMVFLLGKSGSGKSTMLNLLGGLDVYDDGEILIKGKSSKNFKQRDFDSYRNTYLGFIFQEYNVLEEFNVGANIALALQLQGIKATDEKINQILEQVDLVGFGLRKPNELSGGQKQRVAIARALVKDPEIIMADEPTGALDSATGRQVLDTLKKLSQDKLVIVVSHDREFAERYADRIIELADGHVISDMEYFGDAEEIISASETAAEASGITFTTDAVLVAPAYHLTEEDREAINRWIDAKQSGGMIAVANPEGAESLVSANRKCAPTDESRILGADGSTFHMIKSKLPMKNAFKIGASGLKHKKFRLVITIILSFIAYGLFGLADTMGSYDHVSTCSKSIVDTGVSYATFQKENFESYGNYGYWYHGGMLGNEDLEKIEKDTGIEVVGAYRPDAADLDFMSQYDEEAEFTETDYHIYAYGFSGFVEFNEQMLKDADMKLLAGRLPDGSKDEIAISKYLTETFMIGGYRDYETAQAGGSFDSVKTPEDMVGKTLHIAGKNYEIVGVVDTNFDLERYKGLTKLDMTDTSMDTIVKFALSSELAHTRNYSLIQMAIVGDGFIDAFRSGEAPVSMLAYEKQLDMQVVADAEADAYYWLSPFYVARLADLDAGQIVWADEPKTSLSNNEVIVSQDLLEEIIINCGSDKYSLDNVSDLPAFEMNGYNWSAAAEEDYSTNYADCKIVGYIPKDAMDAKSVVVLENSLYDTYAMNKSGIYTWAIGVMPSRLSDIRNVVNYSYKGYDESNRYALMNPVTSELDGLDEVFKTLSKVFIWVGLFFAVFASVMMATFISSSISYKKQEIGILRAIGARGSDVFRIFASESFIIAMINFVLSVGATFAITSIINYFVRRSIGLLVTVLTFGIRQILLLLIISLAVAALASFFPVNHNARKKPIDAIRNR